MPSTYSITFLIKIPLYEETEEFNGILGRNDTEDSSPDSTAICESFERKKKWNVFIILCQCIFISLNN